MAEKLKLQTNVPVTIALKYADGKAMEGEYGDSIMYSLEDGRIWFAPPICGQKLADLGIGKGEPFQVVKAEVANGNRRGGIEYQIKRVAAADTAAPAPAAQTAPVQQMTTASASNNSAQHDRAVEAVFRCLCVASDALAKHRVYNQQTHSWDTKYTEQNILSVAMSLYINASKEAKSWAA
jgi:hypothetical protein